jgi:hypothetical protein
VDEDLPFADGGVRRVRRVNAGGGTVVVPLGGMPRVVGTFELHPVERHPVLPRLNRN